MIDISSYKKGERLLVKLTTGQECVGTVQSKNKDIGRVTLVGVTIKTTGEALKVLHLYEDEFQSVQIVNDEIEPQLSPPSDTETSIEPSKVEKLSDKKQPNVEPPARKQFDTSRQGNIDSASGSPCVDETLTLPSKKITEEELETVNQLINSFLYISGFGKNYNESLMQLRDSRRISVYVSDVTGGRFQRASLIVVGTAYQIFIYDIEQMGDAVFTKGLGKILESETIEKIMFDQRMTSDCLLHKHLVKLKCVRDVEAEDTLLQAQTDRKFRKHTRSLNQLIQSYLGLQNVISTVYVNKDLLTQRPLDQNLQNSVLLRVVYLSLLHDRILHQYLEYRFFKISDIFTTIIRDAESWKATEYHKDLKHIPVVEIRSILSNKRECFDFDK